MGDDDQERRAVTAGYGHTAVTDAGGLVPQLANRGVMLWVEGGTLHYRATQAGLSREELRLLRTSKQRIVESLRRLQQAPGGRAPSSVDYAVPLTYAQRAYWNLFNLDRRQSIRPIAFVTRLRGCLNVPALRESLAAVVQRHDALRSTVILRDAVPLQQVSLAVRFNWIETDFTSCRAPFHDAAIADRIRLAVLEAVDLHSDPPLRAEVVKIADEDCVLILSADHMFADMSSMHVLGTELWRAYRQLRSGQSLELGPVTMQYPHYAAEQVATSGDWLITRAEYVQACLTGYPLVRFPVQREIHESEITGWSSVPVVIDRELRSQLLEFSRRKGMTIVLTALTAYVGAVLRWCRAHTVIIRYQSDGRFAPELANVVGYLASSLYLKIDIARASTLSELLHITAAEYCRACENADGCYFESLLPRPDFTRSPTFNWVPMPSAENGFQHFGLREIRFEPISFEHPMIPGMTVDSEPLLLMHDMGDCVEGRLMFPSVRFAEVSMRHFAGAFLEALAGVLHDGSVPVLPRWGHG